MQLICTFVFAYAKSRFSYDPAHIVYSALGVSDKYLFKPVSHQPYGSRAPVCDDTFLGFVRQPHGVVSNTARLPYKKTRSQGVKNVENLVFDALFIFFVIFVRFLEDVRQLQDTQGCH